VRPKTAGLEGVRLVLPSEGANRKKELRTFRFASLFRALKALSRGANNEAS
jgi:hypothetical protein